jgi:hypothetical protein
MLKLGDVLVLYMAFSAPQSLGLALAQQGTDRVELDRARARGPNSRSEPFHESKSERAREKESLEGEFRCGLLSSVTHTSELTGTRRT